MLRHRRYEGVWWIPGSDEKKVSGWLEIDEYDRPKLETIGALVEDGDFVGTPIPAISGFSVKGKRITLLQCYGSNITFSMPGIPTQKFIAHVVFVGLWTEPDEPLTFVSLSFRFTGIEAWVNRRGHQIERRRDPFEVTVTYRRPNAVDAHLANGTQIRVHFAVNQTEMTVSQSTWVTITPPTSQEWDVLWKTANRLRDFFSLAVGSPVFFTELQATSDLSVQTFDDETLHNNLEVYQLGLKDRTEKSQPRRMLLPFSEIENDLESILSAWFEREDLIRPTLDLYFGTLYEEVLHGERHFLFLAQAAETYHRRTSNETSLTPEDHAERLRTVLSGAPDDHRTWLESKLTYSNELSFRSRLKRLYDRFGDVFKDYIDRSSFANKVVTNRNWLTHYDESLTNSVAKDTIDYLDLIYQLRTMLEACFLSEVGLSNERIKKILQPKIRERTEIISYNRRSHATEGQESSAPD